MISDVLKRVFYPDDYGCIVCEERGMSRKEHSGAVICDECVKSFYKVTAPVCMKCGRSVGGEGSLCRLCAKNDFLFESAASVYNYKGNVKNIIHRLKYSGEQWLADFGGNEMSVKYESLGWNCDFITYVPMYHAKEMKRGYNQAKLLADIVASNSGTECLPLLVRAKNTTPQSLLDRDERTQNMIDAICVADEYKDKTKNKSILVIDDILTTGTSLNECTKALLNCGAAKVYGLCMCSVGDVGR